MLTLVLEDRLFTGFDEVWLCQTVPSSPKPTGIRLTSDVRLSDQDSLEIARWMRSAQCDAGLGDGDGLNFATFEPELVSRIGVERRNGEAISTVHRVTVKRKVVHQHQTHLGKHGGERELPDEWVQFPSLGIE